MDVKYCIPSSSGEVRLYFYFYRVQSVDSTSEYVVVT